MRTFLSVLGAAVLAGCTALLPPAAPPIPSSKGERIPLNKPDLEAAASAPPSRLRSERVTRAPADEDEQNPVEDAAKALTWRFVHGAGRPVLLCAAGHACDLELQSGERITDAIRIGDRSRWGVDVISAKQGGVETPHLIVTPVEPGIETSMVVLTNRRTYHVLLKASRGTSMLHTVFTYPDDLANRWSALEKQAGAQGEVTQ